MEHDRVVRGRRMVRSFRAAPVGADLVDRLIDDALRAPTAGNTRGVDWLVLQGPETRAYWATTTTGEWRETSRRWPGLSRAPVVALALTSPAAYVRRYGEPDKASSGLGLPPGDGEQGEGGNETEVGGEATWPVPYWFGDAAFSTMTLLLGAAAAGLGACFLGNFRGESELLGALGVPSGWRLFGAVLLGYPDGEDHRSASLDRAGRPRSASVHRGRWTRSG
ncbi:MAG TPA: nitroreductase family protein [Acidimicrobiales bacterium]|nr:nitroreductase family protein [Acidimicrobiales bacterium]